MKTLGGLWGRTHPLACVDAGRVATESYKGVSKQTKACRVCSSERVSVWVRTRKSRPGCEYFGGRVTAIRTASFGDAGVATVELHKQPCRQRARDERERDFHY